jgi:hypothetical protein
VLKADCEFDKTHTPETGSVPGVSVVGGLAGVRQRLSQIGQTAPAPPNEDPEKALFHLFVPGSQGLRLPRVRVRLEDLLTS